MFLTRHPASSSTPQSIDAAVRQNGERWHFNYVVQGTRKLVLSDPVSPGRANGLWRATCFEAFVGLEGSAYVELNFSPSGQWAAYRFDAPRQGMREEPAEVGVRVEAGTDWIALEAAVTLSGLAPGAALNLTAVIEEKGGSRSYWALAHPAGAPDFHNLSCFLAHLPE